MRTDDFEDRYYEVIVSPKMFVLKVASKCDFEDKIDKIDKFFKKIQKYWIYDANTWGMNIFIGYMLLTFGENM